MVTGANSGIGYATAEALSRLGARVHMLCRNEQRGREAHTALVQATGGDLVLHLVDVGDPESVARYVEAPGADRVDILVHNAGALLESRVVVEDGLETTLAVHVVGPLRLTAGLLPRMQGNPDEPARVVWVSSGGMYGKKLSVDRLAATSGPFDGVAAYADAKRAQVVLSEQLAARLGPDVVSNAMHPGWAGTPGVVSALPTFYSLTKRILRSRTEGADTVVWLAACRRIARESGRFWFDREAVSTHLWWKTRETEHERERLWEAAWRWAGIPAP